MTATRRTVLTWAAGTATALALAGCSDRGSATPDEVVINVTMAGGTLSPNAEQVSVAKGGRVTVRVSSDVPLTVHVHGYEEVIEVLPGRPAERTFVAAMVGSFEVETHEPARVIAQLVVRQAS